jgi:hypothetical protein
MGLPAIVGKEGYEEYNRHPDEGVYYPNEYPED